MKKNTILTLLLVIFCFSCQNNTSKTSVENANKVGTELATSIMSNNNFRELADREFIFPNSLNDKLIYRAIIEEGYYRTIDEMLTNKPCEKDSLNRFHVTKHGNGYFITTNRLSTATYPTPQVEKIPLSGYFFNRNIFLMRYSEKTEIICFLDKKLYIAVQLDYEKKVFTKQNLEKIFILDNLLLPKHEVRYYHSKNKTDIEVSSYIYSNTYFYSDLLNEKKYSKFVQIKNLNLNNIFLFSEKIEKDYILLKKEVLDEDNIHAFNKHFRYVPVWSDDTI